MKRQTEDQLNDCKDEASSLKGSIQTMKNELKINENIDENQLTEIEEKMKSMVNKLEVRVENEEDVIKRLDVIKQNLEEIRSMIEKNKEQVELEKMITQNETAQGKHQEEIDRFVNLIRKEIGDVNINAETAKDKVKEVTEQKKKLLQKAFQSNKTKANERILSQERVLNTKIDERNELQKKIDSDLIQKLDMVNDDERIISYLKQKRFTVTSEGRHTKGDASALYVTEIFKTRICLKDLFESVSTI